MLREWHLRAQAVLQTIAGGLDPTAAPFVNWVITHMAWPLLLIGYGGAVVLLVSDVLRHLPRKEDGATQWITIKQAVDYVRGQSGWQTQTQGEAWGADLERDLRREFGKLFGPRARGREYSLLASGKRAPVSPMKPIPRSFWRGACFDAQEIIRTPARLVARNEDEKKLFDEIEIERNALERAFPRRVKSVHIPEVPNLKACFESDFPRYLKRDGEVPVRDGPVEFAILAQIHEDYTAHSKFISFFIPHIRGHPHNYTKSGCDYLAANLSAIVEEFHTDGLKVEAHLAGDTTGTPQTSLHFSGAVFVYHEGPLTLAEMGDVEQRFRNAGANVKLRGASYATTKALQERAR